MVIGVLCWLSVVGWSRCRALGCGAVASKCLRASSTYCRMRLFVFALSFMCVLVALSRFGLCFGGVVPWMFWRQSDRKTERKHYFTTISKHLRNPLIDSNLTHINKNEGSTMHTYTHKHTQHTATINTHTIPANTYIARTTTIDLPLPSDHLRTAHHH